MVQRYIDLSFSGIDGHFPNFLGGAPVDTTRFRSLTYGKGGMMYDRNKLVNTYRLFIPNLNVVESEVLILTFCRRNNTQQFTNLSGFLPVVCAVNDQNYYNAFGGSMPDNFRYGGIAKFAANTQTIMLTNPSAYTAPVNDIFDTGRYIRVRREVGKVKSRHWLYGEVEPTTWEEVTDTTHVSGSVGALLQGYDAYFVIPFFSYATDGETAPSTMSKRFVRGTIHKPDDTISPNTKVRLYLAETGKFIDEVVSDVDGNFVFQVNVYEDQLVHVVGVNNSGLEWKPPIHEVFPTTT